MEKYIDVETVEVIARDWACCPEDLDAFMSEIGEASASDVAPVRHGTWKLSFSEYPNPCNEEMELLCDGFICSLCGYGTSCGSLLYCPVCGARMDGQGK